MYMSTHDTFAGAAVLDHDDLGRALRDAFGSPDSAIILTLNQMRDTMKAMTDKLSDVSDRLIRVEENNKRMDSIDKRVSENAAKLTLVDAERNQAAGRVGFLRALKEWAPLVGMIASLLGTAWLYGRSLGITPAPPTPQEHVTAHIEPDDKTIEGHVGGKAP